MQNTDLTERVEALFAAGIEEAGFNSPIIYRPTKAPDETAFELRRESEKSASTRSVRRRRDQQKSGCTRYFSVLASCEMKKSLKILVLIVLAAFLVAGCARTPAPKTSQKVIKKYFKKYGKKYKDTVYGQSRVKDVDITAVEEIHKHLVAVDSFLTLENGEVQRIFVTLEKGPFGWKFISWELAAQ